MCHSLLLRTANSESNARRLSKLWQYSKSHGVRWDDLDRCYLWFIAEKKKREELWQQHRLEILRYASDVVKIKLERQRLVYLKKKGVDVDGIEDEEVRKGLLLPRSMHRQWIRRLYRRWSYNYMVQFTRGRLSEYLKAEVTTRLLYRETHERALHPVSTPTIQQQQQQQHTYQHTVHTPPTLPRMPTFSLISPGAVLKQDYTDTEDMLNLPSIQTEDLCRSNREEEGEEWEWLALQQGMVDGESMGGGEGLEQEGEGEEEREKKEGEGVRKDGMRWKKNERMYLERPYKRMEGSYQPWFGNWDMEGVGVRMLERYPTNTESTNTHKTSAVAS
eukprot:GHVQ01019210.1.p1 GENE.GHVQ01019210.1~~GHVQ01019210.1.p1  ORF type:complete len:348 (-),score=103.29 GHVQ01019210.1:940-1935(-)